ncbi:MAG TPA: PD-(D/E)XK nuclease family protein, partial [Anaeromyxobacteraceae bacterium]
LGIPFAGGRGPPLAELPPVRAVRSALAAAVHPERAALEAVAAAPYLGLARIPARLGFWLDRAGALEGRGDPAEALARRAAGLRSPASAPERAALLRAAGALSQIGAALAPLASPALPRDHAARLRGFLSMAGARRRAARAERDVARRDLAALARVEEVADDVVRALALVGRGGEPLSAQRWLAILEAALDGAAAPAAPEPAAGAVELWALSDAPGLSARAAVVTGCGRGGFPATPAGEPLLRDAERAALNRAAGRAAVASGPMRRAQALHAAFCALAAGREALALTWAAVGPDGGGAPAAPLAVEALVAAGVDVPGAPSRDPRAEESRSAAEALRAASRAARQANAAVTIAPELAGRAASALARGAIESERREAIVARRAAPAAGRVPSALLPELRGALPAEWSPSQLESHARCPYRLFAGLLLGLGDPDAAGLDIDPRDEGKLAHAVLERFLSARLARGGLPLRGAADEVGELRAAARELFARFEADGRTGDPAVWAGRRVAVLARLERVVAAEAAEQDGTIPALLEYRFGGDSGVPPLVFAGEGQEVRLRGRLDRVDASAERLVLIDYKDARLGSEWKRKLDPGALGETNFQVPAYLMAAARALPGRARLDATYLLLRSAERAPPFTASSGDPLFALDEPARAAARETGLRPFADAVLGVVRRIREGELPIASRDCTGCGFGAVCRAQALAEGEP